MCVMIRQHKIADMESRCKRCEWPAPALILAATGGYCEGCEFVSVAEAAARLGLNWRTIHRYIKRGLIASRRAGPKLIRLRRVDVERLLGA